MKRLTIALLIAASAVVQAYAGAAHIIPAPEAYTVSDGSYRLPSEIVVASTDQTAGKEVKPLV